MSPGHGRARDVTTAHGDTAACALHPHRTCCSWIRRRAPSPTSQQVRGTGHPWCSSEQLWSPTRVLSPGSSEGCWELLTLQWDLLVATCSAPHHPPSLVSSALAPCGTVGYGAAMCSQAQLSVAHTPWCGVAQPDPIWHSLGMAQPQCHPLPVSRWWPCCHQQATSCPLAGCHWRTPQAFLVSPGRP